MNMHTPGPWFVPKENAGSSATSVWARGGDVRVADCNSGAVSLPGKQADARLIAAAPELLDACRMAQMLRRLGGMLPGSHEVVQSVVEMADAAIAKATGGV